MKIIRNRVDYIDQLVKVVEEYREFCGHEQSPEKTREFFLNLLDRDESATFIAINSNSEVMGFVNLYPSYSTLSLRRIWILNDLGVSGRFRKQGVAKALVEKAISFARETGAIRIELKTEKTNSNARKLYQELEFNVDSEHIYYRVPV